MDEEICGETSLVLGDLRTGVWEMGGSLKTLQIGKGISLEIIAESTGREEEILLAELDTSDLSIWGEQAKQDFNYHEILECRSDSPVQMVMTCVAKISSLRKTSDDTVTCEPSIGSRISECTLDDSWREKEEQILSLGSLETSYAKLHRLTNPILHARGLNVIGCAYRQIYRENRQAVNLERAITIHEEAMQSTSEFDLRLAEHSRDLGEALLERFSLKGDVADIDRATTLCQNAVDVANDVDTHLYNWLNTLAGCHLSRFRQFGGEEVLNQAISLWNQATELIQDGDPQTYRIIGNLGTALLTRFEWSGNLDDLTQGIARQQEAVDLTPDGHPDKPGWFNNLGKAVQLRFQCLGDVEDLNKAVSFLQAAVDLTPDGHLDKPAWLNDLGSAIQSRFERLGDDEDLDKAILLKRVAVNLMPDDHHDRPIWINSLGIAIHSRFERLGDFEDLDNAILLKQAAVDLMPDVSGNAIQSRFEHLRNFEDLDKAISLKQAAVDLMPDGHPDKTLLLNDLGTAVESRFKCLGDIEDLNKTVLLLRAAVDLTPDGHPNKPDQLNNLGKAFASRFKFSHHLFDLQSAITSYSTAATSPTGPSILRFMAAYAWAGVSRRNGESSIAEFECAINLLLQVAWVGIPLQDQPAQLTETSDVVRLAVAVAVESQEYETAVQWADSFDELHNTDPELAKQLKDVSQQLEGSLSSSSFLEETGPVPLDDVAQKASTLAAAREKIIKQVRKIPGFELFLRPKTFDKLTPAAYEGPVAIINIHKLRCAGNYNSDAVGEKLSDYVVSSYTPTLTAILDQLPPEMTRDFQILTVAQPSTPDATKLPETEKEVKRVKEIAGGIRVRALINEEATTVQVLQAMKESNWIHLACHGVQDRKESLKSGFLLHDKILELSELIREPLPKTDFAFLSACQTAMGDEKVAEESVHLAAGMLFSGCKGVIATMWSIQDEDAPKVTEVVYNWMLKGGVPNRKEAARALHEAVKELRESGADFLSWVPFIHMGR
ncbi:hypothetical protein M408DRAFT_27643 [Serendipita vermifera MAFF 305830]|uniref:CHAT domain-containing protein n=1 Tax=Serendipita vermifera MAFF 305830 TaxID=933852 RepID=A0A0C2WBA0_SERVB|nr:hypothetical protein M408DRAFT_27643 [Serendipita vermifera MAFF 305830]